MRRRSLALAVVAAALLMLNPLVGCERKPPDPAATATVDQPAPNAAGPTTTPRANPLPPPEMLTEVLYKLADTTVPGDRKLSLVEGATSDDAAQIDRFTKALADSGYLPLGFTATDIMWSDAVPGNVAAQVTVRSENPALAGGFSFPMEFRSHYGTWQLARRTADMLLVLGSGPGAPTPPTPAPPPP